MTLGIVLPLVLLALVVFVLVMFARRAARALSVSRAATAFQTEIMACSGRIMPVVDDLVRRVDAVRRHQLPPEEVREALAEAKGTFERERGVIASWQLPSGFTALVGDMSEDVDRLARAVETISFGTELAIEGTGHQRELESQTVIKRGYLNLLHARQSLVDHAATLASRVETTRRRVGSSA